MVILNLKPSLVSIKSIKLFLAVIKSTVKINLTKSTNRLNQTNFFVTDTVLSCEKSIQNILASVDIRIVFVTTL